MRPSWGTCSPWCHKQPQKAKLSWQPPSTQSFRAISDQSDSSTFPGRIIFLFLDFLSVSYFLLELRKACSVLSRHWFLPCKITLALISYVLGRGPSGWTYPRDSPGLLPKLKLQRLSSDVQWSCHLLALCQVHLGRSHVFPPPSFGELYQMPS